MPACLCASQIGFDFAHKRFPQDRGPGHPNTPLVILCVSRESRLLCRRSDGKIHPPSLLKPSAARTPPQSATQPRGPASADGGVAPGTGRGGQSAATAGLEPGDGGGERGGTAPGQDGWGPPSPPGPLLRPAPLRPPGPRLLGATPCAQALSAQPRRSPAGEEEAARRGEREAEAGGGGGSWLRGRAGG